MSQQISGGADAELSQRLGPTGTDALQVLHRLIERPRSGHRRTIAS
jgi:hypothetical protein